MPKFRFDTTTSFQFFQVTRYAFLLLVSILLARMFDDKVIISQYEKLILVAGSISFFWVSGLFNGLIPVYKGSSIAERNSLLRLSFTGGIWLGIVSGLTCGAITQSIFPEVPAQATMFFSIFLMLNTSSFLMEYYLLLESKKIALTVFGLLFYGAYLAAIIYPLSQGHSLAYSMQVLAVLAGAKFLLQTIFLSGRIFSSLKGKGMEVRLWRAAYPLAVAAMLGGSASYIDSYLVSEFFSDEHFVIFQYGAKELPIVLLLAGALSSVKSGEISEALKNGRLEESLKELRRAGLRLMHLFFPLSFVFLLVSPFLYVLVFGESFRDSAMIFNIYLLLIVPRLLFPQAVLRGYLHTKVLMMASGVELFLNLGLSLILMRFWGIEGIAIATVIAYSLEKGLLILYCRNKLQLRTNDYTAIKIWMIYSALLLAAFVAMAWPLTEFFGAHLAK